MMHNEPASSKASSPYPKHSGFQVGRDHSSGRSVLAVREDHGMGHNAHENQKASGISLLLLICLVGLPQILETIYTPSLPDMAATLQATMPQAQWTLSVYFIGFALGVAGWGTWSDHIGRRPAMLLGLGLYVLSSLGCFLSTSIQSLWISRFFQAFGISTGSVVSMAMMRDLYTGQERHRIFATTSMALALAPALGPFLGGYTVQWFYWRANFMVLLVLGTLLTLYSLFCLPETYRRSPISNNGLKTNNRLSSIAKELLKDKSVWAAALLVGEFNGLLFSYYAEAPFLFITVLGYLPGHYGSLGVIVALAGLMGSYLSRRLSQRYQPTRLILAGCLMNTVSMGLLLINAWLGLITPGDKALSLLTLLAPMLGFFIGFGLVIPNTLSIALANYLTVVGTAGSIFGLMYYLLVGLFLFLMGFLHNGSVITMPTYFFVLSMMLSWAAHFLHRRASRGKLL